MPNPTAPKNPSEDTRIVNSVEACRRRSYAYPCQLECVYANGRHHDGTDLDCATFKVTVCEGHHEQLHRDRDTITILIAGGIAGGS